MTNEVILVLISGRSLRAIVTQDDSLKHQAKLCAKLTQAVRVTRHTHKAVIEAPEEISHDRRGIPLTIDADEEEMNLLAQVTQLALNLGKFGQR